MKDLERELGLKVTGLFIAIKADSDRMVPASRGDSPAVMGALVTEALSTGPTVVLGKLDAEFLPAVVAVQDLVVGHPVCRPGRILYQTCGGEGTTMGGTPGSNTPSPATQKGSLRHFTGSPSNCAHDHQSAFKTHRRPAFTPHHPGQNPGAGPRHGYLHIKLSKVQLH